MVVVQYADSGAVGERGDEQIDGRKAMISDAGQLRLRADGTLLDDVVNVVPGE